MPSLLTAQYQEEFDLGETIESANVTISLDYRKIAGDVLVYVELDKLPGVDVVLQDSTGNPILSASGDPIYVVNMDWSNIDTQGDRIHLDEFNKLRLRLSFVGKDDKSLVKISNLSINIERV